MINIDRRDNIFKDNIAYVERYDCSKNNIDDESRILAVTKIASVCYNKEASIGKKSLFDRLASESMGLPSSSFEFIPVLFKWDDIVLRIQADTNYMYTIADSNILKYGMLLTVNDVKYLLTNYRGLVYDYEELGVDYRNTYNKSEEEQKIIRDNYYIFKYNIDLPTIGQLVRHRVNHQILSRRYVSGKKLAFSFYVSEKMKEIISSYTTTDRNNHSLTVEYNTNDIIDICLNHYYTAIDSGVKAEDARRIIPQAAYTTGWIGFNKKQLKSFLGLRTEYHAQPEIRELAISIQSMIG